jgi:phosphatidylglycerol lysyltransferase
MRSAAIARQPSLDHDFPLAPGGKNAFMRDGAAGQGLDLPPLRRSFARFDWTRFSVLLGLALFGVAAFVLYRTLEQVTWVEVWAAWWRISLTSIVCAALATAGSYFALVGYDALALRQTGARHVTLRFTALTSLVSHALTFTLGFGMLTGGALRLRLYQSQGLEVGHILAIGVFCALTFWMGLAAVTGLCLIAEPSAFAMVGGVAAPINIAVGAGILALLAGWAAATAIRPRHMMIAGWKLDFPGPAASLGAVFVGVSHTAFAALALWLLLPAGGNMPFAAFIVVFVAATIVAVISYVPGGLGVFEAVILLALPNVPPAETIGALALFRAIYYIAPFTLATATLAVFELRARQKTASVARRQPARVSA